MSTERTDQSAEWCVAALSEFLPVDKPLAIKRGSTEYVLYRDQEGVPHALEDSCAHRRAPLSLGCVTPAGLIECPYHGWRYDGTGACKAIPNLSSRERVPRTYRVAAFAVHEEDGFIQLCTSGMEPATPPVHLGLTDMPERWFGEQLIAYPYSEFIDMLLDAPGSILDIRGLAPCDDHRFGDPVIVDDEIRVTYGAAPRGIVRPGRIIADFPYSLGLAVRRDGRLAVVKLFDEAQLLLAELVIAASPIERALTDVKWRGSALATGKGAFLITVKNRLDPAAILVAKDYCSRLRKENAVKFTEGEYA